MTIWASAVSDADLGGAHPQRAVLVDRGADDLPTPGALCTGRLSPVTIDSSTSLSPSTTAPSTGDLRAGADEQQIADDDLGGRDLDRFAVAEHDRLRRGQVEQRADRVVGAAAGPHLEPVAEQHERGQHGGRLVEHLPAAGEGDTDASRASRRRSRPRPAPSCPGCAARSARQAPSKKIQAE